jgi:ribose 5-phosphate isomerase A
MRMIVQMGGKPVLRESDGKLGPVITDNGNYVIDAHFEKIDFPRKLDTNLRSIPGIVETGLFLGMADIIFIGRIDGSVQTIRRKA